MKKYIKLLSLILAICVLATMFTACKKKDMFSVDGLTR